MSPASRPTWLVGSVQWGGGTPSQLGPERLLKVGRRLAALFDARSDREMSMEVDPRFCDQALADTMVALGVTRVSLGVQDFDLAVQQAINRLQSPELTAAAIDAAAAARPAPLQHRPGLRAAAADAGNAVAHARRGDRARARPVRRVRLRPCSVDEAAPGGDRRRTLPGAAERAAMAGLVEARLVGAGYVKIGLDHYARPGDALARAAAHRRLRRNFQGYVADETPWVVGVGASAISCLPQGYTQNAARAGSLHGSHRRRAAWRPSAASPGQPPTACAATSSAS